MRRVRITAELTPFDYTERFSFIPAQDRRARTLQDYLDEFGGDLEGEVPTPFGGREKVSLRSLAGQDPSLFLALRFRVSPEDGEFPPDYSDAVVLKEYDLPPGTELPGT